MAPGLTGLAFGLLLKEGNYMAASCLLALYLIWEFVSWLQYTNTTVGFWLWAVRRHVGRKLGRR
jgi:hypothetical protein